MRNTFLLPMVSVSSCTNHMQQYKWEW